MHAYFDSSPLFLLPALHHVARLPSGIAGFARVPVGVAQGDAEMPGDGLQGGAGDVDQGDDDDEDVDGRPAHDEDGHHHQHHARDATQIPVLLLGPPPPKPRQLAHF